MSLAFSPVRISDADFIGGGAGNLVPRPSFSCPCEKFCGRSADIVEDIVRPPLPSREQ